MSYMSFTKLFAGIIHSTVWREAMHIKVVWVTMLAMADRNGHVLASLPGLADAARVSLQECEEALAKLKSPDPYSRTKDHEGRRVEDIDGGWLILNYLKYREVRDVENRREQVREAVRRHRTRSRCVINVSNVSHESQCNPKQKQKQKQRTEQQASPAAPRVTWLTPYCEAWTAATGGKAPADVFAGVFKRLEELHPREKVLAHWRNYLARVPAQYANAPGFETKFGAYAPGSDPTSRPAGNWDTPDVSEAARRYAQEVAGPEPVDPAVAAWIEAHGGPEVIRSEIEAEPWAGDAVTTAQRWRERAGAPPGVVSDVGALGALMARGRRLAS